MFGLLNSFFSISRPNGILHFRHVLVRMKLHSQTGEYITHASNMTKTTIGNPIIASTASDLLSW